jgi:endoglucanase
MNFRFPHSGLIFFVHSWSSFARQLHPALMKYLPAVLFTILSSLSACAQVYGEAAVTKGPVSEHGALRVDGRKIVGADGQPVSLAGNSFFWSQWQGQLYNARVVEWLKKDWKSSIVRAALGIHADGYLGHPEAEKAKVCAVVDAAIAADLYVIIDWHDHHANEHTDLAVAFFQEMARKYGRDPHVIYEIFNEPTTGLTWDREVKPYAEKLVAAIRAIDPVNLIIIGTPNWSQDVDIAAAHPVAGANLAYTLHFYAATHKQKLRDKALVALQKGLPLFVTEWGTCKADGNGSVDVESTTAWMAFMREWQLSHCNWAISDKKEAASILIPGAAPEGHWRDQQLTESGRVAREWIRSWATRP